MAVVEGEMERVASRGPSEVPGGAGAGLGFFGFVGLVMQHPVVSDGRFAVRLRG
jgi:hypothetical protein